MRFNSGRFTRTRPLPQLSPRHPLPTLAYSPQPAITDSNPDLQKNRSIMSRFATMMLNRDGFMEG